MAFFFWPNFRVVHCHRELLSILGGSLADPCPNLVHHFATFHGQEMAWASGGLLVGQGPGFIYMIKQVAEMHTTRQSGRGIATSMHQTSSCSGPRWARSTSNFCSLLSDNLVNPTWPWIFFQSFSDSPALLNSRGGMFFMWCLADEIRKPHYTSRRNGVYR